MFLSFLFVALGGAVGAMGRYGVTLLAASLGATAPWATLAVNVVGAFLLGVLVAYLGTRTGALYAGLAVGVLGALTTFSTFALDAVTLMEERGLGMAGLYVVGSVAGALLAVALGLFLGRSILS